MQWNLYKLTTLQRQNHKLQDCNPGAPPCNDGFAALYFPCGQSGPERRLCRQFIFSLPPEFVATFPVFFWYRSLPISPHLTPARRRAKKPFPLGQETQSANDFAFFNKTVGHENLPDKTVPFGGLPVKGRPIFWWRKEWNSLKQRLDHGTRESSMISPNFLPHLPMSCTWTAPFSMCKVSNFWIVGKILYKHFNSVVWKDLLRNRGISTLFSFLQLQLL